MKTSEKLGVGAVLAIALLLIILLAITYTDAKASAAMAEQHYLTIRQAAMDRLITQVTQDKPARSQNTHGHRKLTSTGVYALNNLAARHSGWRTAALDTNKHKR